MSGNNLGYAAIRLCRTCAVSGNPGTIPHLSSYAMSGTDFGYHPTLSLYPHFVLTWVIFALHPCLVLTSGILLRAPCLVLTRAMLLRGPYRSTARSTRLLHYEPRYATTPPIPYAPSSPIPYAPTPPIRSTDKSTACQYAVCPYLVPKTLHFDRSHALIVMQFIPPPHKILRKCFMAGERISTFAKVCS